ncbi:unnamed protein product [Calypogeia fissa]
MTGIGTGITVVIIILRWEMAPAPSAQSTCSCTVLLPYSTTGCDWTPLMRHVVPNAPTLLAYGATGLRPYYATYASGMPCIATLSGPRLVYGLYSQLAVAF